MLQFIIFCPQSCLLVSYLSRIDLNAAIESLIPRIASSVSSFFRFAITFQVGEKSFQRRGCRRCFRSRFGEHFLFQKFVHFLSSVGRELEIWKRSVSEKRSWIENWLRRGNCMNGRIWLGGFELGLDKQLLAKWIVFFDVCCSLKTILINALFKSRCFVCKTMFCSSTSYNSASSKPEIFHFNLFGLLLTSSIL